MSQNPFRLHGTTPAKCLGRHEILSRIADAFDADDPANVSVFGPKYIGKTVLLHEVAARYARLDGDMPNEKSPFDGVVYWDLRHGGITDQDSFYTALARALAPAIAPFNKDAADILVKSGNWDNIRLVASELADEEQRVLVVMDNFDALMRARISQGTWENIRNLHADIGSVYYLVGSRRSLGDLCSIDQEGYDLSDFPRIFDVNIELGCFSSSDGAALRQVFGEKKVSFEKGSDTELDRWTGGVPALTTLVCGCLWERTSMGDTLKHTDVQQAVTTLRQEPDLGTTLKALWKSTGDNGQQVLATLAQPETPDTLGLGHGVSNPVATDLVKRGYVEQKGNTISSSCALMQEHALEYGEAATAIYQLFGTHEGFIEHMPRVLAKRSSWINKDRLDTLTSGLFRKAEHIIEHANEPEIMIAQVRSFAKQAIDTSIKVLCPDGQIPIQWTARWKSRGNPDKAMEGTVPSKTSQRLRLLADATFSDYGLDVPLSRSSYILLSYLHQVGNEGQHLTSDLWPAFAHSVGLAVVSLCDQLGQELVPADAEA